MQDGPMQAVAMLAELHAQARAEEAGGCAFCGDAAPLLCVCGPCQRNAAFFRACDAHLREVDRMHTGIMRDVPAWGRFTPDEMRAEERARRGSDVADDGGPKCDVRYPDGRRRVCPRAPALRCACPRCLHPDERFYSCVEHRHEVDAAHYRVYGRSTQWEPA